MGAFKIEIIGVGGHGCDRKAKPGDKLYQRCGRFGCPDCMAHDFVMQMRQRGMLSEGMTYPIYDSDGKQIESRSVLAEFTHWPTDKNQVVDDMLKNERKSGQF